MEKNINLYALKYRICFQISSNLKLNSYEIFGKMDFITWNNLFSISLFQTHEI